MSDYDDDHALLNAIIAKSNRWANGEARLIAKPVGRGARTKRQATRSATSGTQKGIRTGPSTSTSPVTRKSVSFVSLFSGGGGMDIGLEKAGFSCVFATDHDPAAVATLEGNKGRMIARGKKALANAAVMRADISTITGSAILKAAGVRKGDVALLAGGPPCQSWSSAGKQRGFDDPRGRLFHDYLRIASELEVPWLLFENVRGLLTARGPDGIPGSALALMRNELLARGWQTRVDLLNAADFGVPQRRVRLFIIGYRKGNAPPLPQPTHCERLNLAGGIRWKSLRAALAEIAPPSHEEIIRPSEKLAEELRDLRPGTGAKSPGKKETTRPGGHWGYKQGAFIADLQQPARTITASAQQDWIRDPKLGLRRLSPRECATLQTFPEEWAFAGKRADQYRLIGNAVPPTLAAAVGRTLLQHVRSAPAHTLVPSRRALDPLPPTLASAIRYTQREERTNGASRRGANPVERELHQAWRSG